MMMMIRGMATALIEEVEMGLLMEEEGMVVVDAPQVHTRGIEAALIMGMGQHQILELSEGAVLIMVEPLALSMIDIKAAHLQRAKDLLLHAKDLHLHAKDLGLD